MYTIFFNAALYCEVHGVWWAILRACIIQVSVHAPSILCDITFLWFKCQIGAQIAKKEKMTIYSCIP